eukprot:scaffold1573_cov173-Amphora_coffeaeformis.AAC.10
MASDDDFSMSMGGDEDDSVFGDDENQAVNRVHAVKAEVADDKPAVLHTSTNDTKKSKTIEETYKKKTPLEHILLRPDTYIGSVEQNESDTFVVQDDRIVRKTVMYTPGLFKIFDEIVVNAADNKQRDPDMDKLEINIDATANWISVMNNGKGIPIEMHKEHGMYVPTLIFGELLTGSNFDDDEKKTTGGRNGYGAKLANVFSTQFEVECVSTESGKIFKQMFRNNMSTRDAPEVKKLTKAQEKKGDYVKISFSPDLQRFKIDCLDEDIVGLMKRRAYDIAASLSSSKGKRLNVSLNGNKLPIKSFEDYIKCFQGVNKPVVFQKIDRWEVGIGLSDSSTQQQISFVNSIFTSKGGTHVDYISNQVIKHLTASLKKKKHDVARNLIKNHLFIFVNCLIENPAFDSQTKENLITKQSVFGSKCNLEADFLKKIDKSDIPAAILQYARFDQNRKLKSKSGTKKKKLTGIAKLDDANHAGSAKSKDCTLIVTEGDSAKSLAMAGLSVVGRDYYGVFPLRGKPLNVRDAALAQVTNNEEIKNLVEILGLKYNTKYDESNIKTLRYGHLMVMADQDTDGSHIKGLIINFLHKFWPSLLDVPGFLQQFITPIVKATKGKKVKTFFNLPEYEQWLESTGNGGKGWSVKYYKGLGTSTSAEAKEYFSRLHVHEINFGVLSNDKVSPQDELDTVLPDTVQSGSDLIDMIFRKERVSDRKQWLETKVDPDRFLDYSLVSKAEGVRYSDFFNKEYILFSLYDNMRSIPHVMDGFKPSQRKVLFGCLKRKLTKGEIKVAQLTGYIAEHSAYHHGETSLQGTIVCMASNYCGSNNVNLLTPSGQFGTRRMGGKDAASARYIFTKLEPIARTIFHPDDDQLLNYLKDDGNDIEPEYYVPVIPMILVNGADGIGSGWSCNIPNFNPRDIIANLRRMINNEEIVPMSPHYHGFTGDIIVKGPGKFAVHGKIERTDEDELLITELPIKVWTQTYKEMLEKMMTGDDKKPSEILDFKENHTETTVSFTVTAKKEKIDEFEKEPGGLLKKFKLNGSMATSNMVLFQEGKLVKFDTPEEILKVFYDVRHDFYVKRKDLLVKNLQTEQRKLSNKARFVEEVCAGSFIVSNRKRVEILMELKERGYDTFNTKNETNLSDAESEEEDNQDDGLSTAELAKGYEYLLGMKIWSLTFEKAEALRAELAEKTQELEDLMNTSPNHIWLADLDAIEEALDQRDAEFSESAADELKAMKANKKKQAKTSKKAGKKKKDEWEFDDDEEEDDDDKMDLSSEDEVFVVKKQPAKRKPAAIKAAPKPAPKPVVVPKAMDVENEIVIASDSEKDDVEVKGLADRLKKKLSTSRISPQSLSGDSLDSQLVHASVSPVKVSSAPKVAAAPKMTAAAKKKKTVAVKPATKTVTAKKPTKVTKKAPAKKKATKKYDSEDESEDEFAFQSDSSASVRGGATAPAASRPQRGRVATAKDKSYNFDMSDDDDSDF